MGRKAEKKAGKRLGARVIPGSGTIPSLKGDLSTKSFLIESKATTKKSLSVKLDWLRKIDQEALEEGRDPALLVQFTDADGAVVRGGAWVCIPEALFKELCE